MPTSQPYIKMTISMIQSFGVFVKADFINNTFYIPNISYQNPNKYIIESDASSAVYPLAIAAITGNTCIIPNIGSNSLQGDSKFALKVLRPMGCHVLQESGKTIVTEPNIGGLHAIPKISMEEMTDSFLALAVLASVAKGTTVIKGVSNQRFKECNRISAMKTELNKCGITCRELDDGLQILGQSIFSINTPNEGIFAMMIIE